MKKEINTKYSVQNTAYNVFLGLIILIPLVFWKDFDNGFDLVKSSVLKAAGGVFIILCMIYWISAGLKKNKTQSLQVDKALDPVIFIFFISVLISTIFSVNPYVSLIGNYETQIGLMLYIFLFLIYFLMPLIINNDKKFRKAILAMEFTALITAAFTIIEYLGLNPLDLKPSDFIRPVSPVGHPVFTAGFLILLLPLSAANISGKKSAVLKILIPTIIFAGIILTQTRSAYAAVIILIILFVVFYPFILNTGKFNLKKQIIYPAVILFSLLLLILLFIVYFPENTFVKRFLSISTITSLPRWFLWKDSINMFLHHPATGTGLSTFSNVFENYASYSLKYAEVKGFFVNAHNNFLNMFCTTGILGGAAYLIMLLQLLRLSLKKIISAKQNTNTKLFYFACIGTTIGYMVYGLADFDDITILFYLFVFLSLFKINHIKNKHKKDNSKLTGLNVKLRFIIGIILIAFSVYNIYLSITDLTAQNIYSASTNKYFEGDINGYIEGINNVISLKPDEAYYRYKFAYNILVYSSGMDKNSVQTKMELLERAKNEVTVSEKNYRSRLEYLSLKSLIELELGNEQEGLNLKKEIFKTDTTQFQYRTNLAVYYLNHNNDGSAIYEINSILNWDIKNTRVMTLKVIYLERNKLFEDASALCRKILEIEPGNQFAAQTLKRLMVK